jgi:arylsulfatase
MIERGIVPEGTELTPLNPLPEGKFAPGDALRPWDSLSEEEKALFRRMAEVYAGFSEYTDAQVGRIIDYLEESGQLDNTIIFYCADNGASGEGSPNGSVNEGKFFNTYPDKMEDNLPYLDRLGSPDTYNHYPTGWAVAFSTPYKMFKRYTYQGGVCDPLVISWPAGIKSRGEVRHQYHHCTDIVPTILECCGVEMPRFVNGAEQTPMPGVSMKYTFDAAPDAATRKVTQYYEMLGSRGLWHDGWKVVAEHGPLAGIPFVDDTWQLFHTDVDRAEANDLAGQFPAKAQELRDMWYAEAGKYDVQPGKRIFGVDFAREGTDEVDQPYGTTKLYVDDTVVDKGPMKVIAVQFSLCGEGLCIGYDGGDAVSREYGSNFDFRGGTIHKVVFDVSDAEYLDAETSMASLMARD